MNHDRDGTPADSPLVHRVLEEKSRQQMLDVLGDPIRRQVLRELHPDEGWVKLSGLAERVGNRRVRGASGFPFQSNEDAISADADSAGAPPTDRVALRLHHVHLPKLDDYGLVEYEHRERTVRATTTS